MQSLPDADTIGRHVSTVSEVMFGVTFVHDDSFARGESICGHMVRLPLEGVSGASVVLSSDRAGSQALAAAFYSCRPHSLTEPMIDKALGELLKMVALQIQGAMQIDKRPGSPTRTTLAEMALSDLDGDGAGDDILLRSTGLGDLKLWVVRRAQRPNVHGGFAPALRTFRSFIQRFLPSA